MEMGPPRGKFRMRIRKMKPEPITVRTRQAWGKSKKKEETVLGTIFVSLFCFKILRVSRRNEDDDEDDIPTTDLQQVQIDIGDDCTPESVGNYGPIPSEGAGVSMADSDHDETVYPNLIRVLEYIQSSSLERLSSPLPGAVEEADPSSFFTGGGAAAVAGPSSLPTSVSTQVVEQAHSTGDLKLASLPSSEEQQEMKDKKQKKSKKKNKQKSKEKRAAGKNGKKSKSSGTKEDSSSSKIPSVKEWAKQEEKKKKAEKRKEEKELKQDKQKQKQMKKLAAKAKKLKKAQKLQEEKESKKAEKEAAKAKKAAEKAEKVAAKAKESAAKAEAKKKEKESKLALRMQLMLEESDKQMTADLERDRLEAEERTRKQEEKARETMKSIAKTEHIIKILQKKLERKEKKVAQLIAHRDGNRHISMVVAFKLHYKITDYNRKIHSISNVINKQKKKVKAKQEEVEKLAPHLLKTELPTETQEDGINPCSLISNDADHTDAVHVAADNDSILDMLSYFDSESECSDEEEEEEELPREGNTHPNVQEILCKAQESLQKMDEDKHKVPSVFFR